MKPAYWDRATASLAASDSVLARLVAEYPDVHLQRRGEPFTVLARAIVGQQISVKAAQSIWDRFVRATDGKGGKCEKVPLLIIGGPCQLESGYKKGELVTIQLDTGHNLFPNGDDGQRFVISTDN